MDILLIMSDLLKQIGGKIREVRIKKGLTQEDLADKSGLHSTYIGGVERGERNLTVLSLEKIAKGLDLDIRDFLERRKEKRYPTAQERVSGEIMQMLRRKDEKTLQLATRVVRDVINWKK